jgi:hypothetical protein
MGQIASTAEADTSASQCSVKNLHAIVALLQEPAGQQASVVLSKGLDVQMTVEQRISGAAESRLPIHREKGKAVSVAAAHGEG